VSIRGNIKPVGGIREKLHAAEQADLKEILIPRENLNDINQDTGLVITPISNVTEALKRVLINHGKNISLVK